MSPVDPNRRQDGNREECDFDERPRVGPPGLDAVEGDAKGKRPSASYVRECSGEAIPAWNWVRLIPCRPRAAGRTFSAWVLGTVHQLGWPAATIPARPERKRGYSPALPIGKDCWNVHPHFNSSRPHRCRQVPARRPRAAARPEARLRQRQVRVPRLAQLAAPARRRPRRLRTHRAQPSPPPPVPVRLRPGYRPRQTAALPAEAVGHLAYNDCVDALMLAGIGLLDRHRGA